MRKRMRCYLVGIIIIAVSIVLPEMVYSNPADSSKKIGFGLEAGYATFSDDNFNAAPNVALNIFYNLSRQIRLELKGGFLSVDVEEDAEGFSKGTLKVIPLELNLQYYLKLNTRWSFYVSGGVGYYLNNFTVENDNIWQNLGFEIAEEVENVIGFQFGGGLDYLFSNRMAFNINVRYCAANLTGTYSITELDSGISHSDDIEKTLGFLSFGAGIKYLF